MKTTLVEQAVLKHQEAKTVSTQLRASFDKLVAPGHFGNLKTSDLPDTVLREVCGFDVLFVDLHLRMLVTGSLTTNSSLVFECWRLPVAYGRDPENVLVLPVIGGKMEISKMAEPVWFDEPKAAFAILNEVLSRHSTSTLDRVR